MDTSPQGQVHGRGGHYVSAMLLVGDTALHVMMECCELRPLVPPNVTDYCLCTGAERFETGVRGTNDVQWRRANRANDW